VEAALAADDFTGALEGLVALSLVAGAGLEQSLPGRAELAVQALQSALPRLQGANRRAVTRRQESRLLVDALVSARLSLRKGRQWEAADALRDTLLDLGYVVADTADGTTWSGGDGTVV
jgi:cysteinyl-tRNA synthetase